MVVVLVFDRGKHAKGAVMTLAIVEDLEVFEDRVDEFPGGAAGVGSSAASGGVELVFLALVDSVGAITSAVGGDVTEAQCDDDDGNDPQGVDSEADQPENQCGAQDHQHHLAEACALAEQERDPLGQPAPFGCLAGAACRLGERCWQCSLR
jgi:hypothetical protein